MTESRSERGAHIRPAASRTIAVARARRLSGAGGLRFAGRVLARHVDKPLARAPLLARAAKTTGPAPADPAQPAAAAPPIVDDGAVREEAERLSAMSGYAPEVLEYLVGNARPAGAHAGGLGDAALRLQRSARERPAGSARPRRATIEEGSGTAAAPPERGPMRLSRTPAANAAPPAADAEPPQTSFAAAAEPPETSIAAAAEPPPATSLADAAGASPAGRSPRHGRDDPRPPLRLARSRATSAAPQTAQAAGAAGAAGVPGAPPGDALAAPESGSIRAAGRTAARTPAGAAATPDSGAGATAAEGSSDPSGGARPAAAEESSDPSSGASGATTPPPSVGRSEAGAGEPATPTAAGGASIARTGNAAETAPTRGSAAGRGSLEPQRAVARLGLEQPAASGESPPASEPPLPTAAAATRPRVQLVQRAPRPPQRPVLRRAERPEPQAAPAADASVEALAGDATPVPALGVARRLWQRVVGRQPDAAIADRRATQAQAPQAPSSHATHSAPGSPAPAAARPSLLRRILRIPAADPAAQAPQIGTTGDKTSSTATPTAGATTIARRTSAADRTARSASIGAPDAGVRTVARSTSTAAPPPAGRSAASSTSAPAPPAARTTIAGSTSAPAPPAATAIARSTIAAASTTTGDATPAPLPDAPPARAHRHDRSIARAAGAPPAATGAPHVAADLPPRRPALRIVRVHETSFADRDDGRPPAANLARRLARATAGAIAYEDDGRMSVLFPPPGAVLAAPGETLARQEDAAPEPSLQQPAIGGAAAAPAPAPAAPLDRDDLYEDFVRRLRRDVLEQREQLGDL